MSSWSQRVSVATVLLGTLPLFAGCDNNAAAPAASQTKLEKKSIDAPPAPSGKAPGANKTSVGNTPIPPD